MNPPVLAPASSTDRSAHGRRQNAVEARPASFTPPRDTYCGPSVTTVIGAPGLDPPGRGGGGHSGHPHPAVSDHPGGAGAIRGLDARARRRAGVSRRSPFPFGRGPGYAGTPVRSGRSHARGSHGSQAGGGSGRAVQGGRLRKEERGRRPERGTSAPRSAPRKGGAGSGTGSSPGPGAYAATPDSTRANGHPRRVGERRRRCSAGRPPSRPRGRAAGGPCRPRRPPACPPPRGNRPSGGHGRDDRSRTGHQAPGHRVGRVEVGGDEPGAVAHRPAMPGRARRSRSRGETPPPPPPPGARHRLESHARGEALDHSRNHAHQALRRRRRQDAASRSAAAITLREHLFGRHLDPAPGQLGHHLAHGDARVVRHEARRPAHGPQAGDRTGRRPAPARRRARSRRRGRGTPPDPRHGRGPRQAEPSPAAPSAASGATAGSTTRAKASRYSG